MQNRTIRRTIAAAGLAAVLGLTIVAPAPAGKRQGYEGPPEYVVAESARGNGTVKGAVRPGRNGVWQVQMPRGTWIDCVRSCSETLRRATVDFWETQGPNAKDTGPGYFRWNFYLR